MATSGDFYNSLAWKVVGEDKAKVFLKGGADGEANVKLALFHYFDEIESFEYLVRSAAIPIRLLSVWRVRAFN